VWRLDLGGIRRGCVADVGRSDLPRADLRWLIGIRRSFFRFTFSGWTFFLLQLRQGLEAHFVFFSLVWVRAT
jgi:hypothetical protein